MDAKEFISNTVGKPWISRACGPHGFDCWGLVIASFRDIDGVELPEIGKYSDINGDNAEAGSDGINGYKSELSSGKDGDIMIMYSPSGDFEHVGRVLCGGVLHAWGRGGNGTGQVKWDRIALLKRLYKNVEFRRYADFS